MWANSKKDFTIWRFLWGHKGKIETIINNKRILDRLDALGCVLAQDRMQCGARVDLGQLLGPLLEQHSLDDIAETL